jgi:HD-GYP domain-containing protein (c-di-GMP phosphodiesterase class II)
VATQLIPEGSSLLAAADAWDVMTISRPYSIPKSPHAALAECIELTGIQFTATAVAALRALHGAGELGIDRPERSLDAPMGTA